MNKTLLYLYKGTFLTLLFLASIACDIEATVRSIAFTSDEKTYKADEVIQVTVTFTEAVDVDTTKGTPKVVLKIGTVDKEAMYKSGSGTPQLVFAYTVQAGDIDTNGIEIPAGAVALDGGTITNTTGNTAILTHSSVPADTARTVEAVRAWHVSTVAGGNETGDADGIGTDAQFKYPSRIAVASATDGTTIYVADAGNHRIRKITSTGVVSTFAGSTSGYKNAPTGTDAQFNVPFGIAVAADGTIYVVDTLNDRIRKITSMGAVSTFAGSKYGNKDAPTGTDAQFGFPRGIAVTADGTTIYIADTHNHRIRKITSTGVVSTVAGSTSGYKNATHTAAQFNEPFAIAVAADGTIYIADTHNHRIRKITSTGVVSTFAGSTSGYKNATGTEAQFNFPYGIAVAADGTIYVADTFNHRIRKITSTGVVTTIAGGEDEDDADKTMYADGIGTKARFNRPYGIAVAADGTIYVADTFNERIRKLEFK